LLFVCLLAVLGMKPRDFLSEHSTTKLHPGP
jgi:hypothetical protein